MIGRRYRTGNDQMDQPAALSEDELLSALRAGDDRAAEAVVRLHAPWMLAVARRMTRDHALAEDCVQDAFVNAFRKIGDFEGRSSLKTWLHRIVVNQALMKIRSRGRRREDPIDGLLPEFDDQACRIEAPWQHMATPDQVLERDDQRAMVRNAIDRLPDNYRIVLQLRDIEEWSTAEVAEALELSQDNVKVRLHRARSALKKLLEPVLRGEL
jgi:RNA polymerase sigma-70 factor (ECF subfamily)